MLRVDISLRNLLSRHKVFLGQTTPHRPATDFAAQLPGKICLNDPRVDAVTIRAKALKRVKNVRVLAFRSFTPILSSARLCLCFIHRLHRVPNSLLRWAGTVDLLDKLGDFGIRKRLSLSNRLPKERAKGDVLSVHCVAGYGPQQSKNES